MPKRSTDRPSAVAEQAAALREAIQTPEGLEVFSRYNMMGVADRLGVPDTPLARRDWVSRQLEQLEQWARTSPSAGPADSKE